MPPAACVSRRWVCGPSVSGPCGRCLTRVPVGASRVRVGPGAGPAPCRPTPMDSMPAMPTASRESSGQPRDLPRYSAGSRASCRGGIRLPHARKSFPCPPAAPPAKIAPKIKAGRTHVWVRYKCACAAAAYARRRCAAGTGRRPLALRRSRLSKTAARRSRRRMPRAIPARPRSPASPSPQPHPGSRPGGPSAPKVSPRSMLFCDAIGPACVPASGVTVGAGRPRGAPK